MKTSLRVKLSAAFVALTLLLFLLVGGLANFLLERQFRQYVISNQEKMINDTVRLIAARYNDWGGNWNVGGIETIGMNALANGLIVRLDRADGRVIWDARIHNGGMCADLLVHMSENMKSYFRDFKGGYTEKRYPLTVGGENVATVTIGYYGPYFFSDSDLNFIATLNRLLIWAAFVSALAALGTGLFMARRLTRPIVHVVKAAKRISTGDFSDRVSQKSGTTEIVELTDAINSLAETLGEQDSMRKRLTADVAHELRTPLATLQSHLEAMIDGVWEPDAARLASCHEETVRLSRLVSDLENLSRYEKEDLQLDLRPIDLSALLGRIVTNFESQFRRKGIRLDFSPDEQYVEADEDKLSQVFINLISNALKYTNAGGAVSVGVSGAEQTAVVRVADTGIGIPEEDQPHIFERFYRTDKSRSRLTGGSGIGLTIARAIVEAHRGGIMVESKTGEGSVFSVWLPKA
jgi:signal transduction histidine kinase